MKKIILVWMVMGLGVGLASAQETLPKDKTIKVSGQGIITAVPDEATIEVTVQEEGASLDDQVAKTKTKMMDLFDALKSNGISPKDMQTTEYSINPKYQYSKVSPKGSDLSFPTGSKWF